MSHLSLTDRGRPFVISLQSDTDGYYAIEYQVAGRRIGAGHLVLTSDDIVAQWHHRSGPEDFHSGDEVIVKESGARAMALAPISIVHNDGRVDEMWLIVTDDEQRHVRPDQIRVALPEELDQGDT